VNGRGALLLAAALAGGIARACGEYDGWEHLPQVHEIRFRADAVGFAAHHEYFDLPRWFERDRRAGEVRELTREAHAVRYADAPGSRTSLRGWDEVGGHLKLVASDGAEYLAEEGYCGEGEVRPGTLASGGRRIAIGGDECDSVAAVEHLGDHRLLGTYRPVECGTWGRTGLLVQRRSDGAVVARVLPATGRVVRAVARDPFAPLVWVATEGGVEVIDARHFATREALRLAMRFDASQRPRLAFVARVEDDDPVATLAWMLAVADPAVFRSAAPAFRIGPGKTPLYDHFMSGAMPAPFFAPLTPLRAAYRDAVARAAPPLRRWAVNNLCKLPDRAVDDELPALIAATADETLRAALARCQAQRAEGWAHYRPMPEQHLRNRYRRD